MCRTWWEERLTSHAPAGPVGVCDRRSFGAVVARYARESALAAPRPGHVVRVGPLGRDTRVPGEQVVVHVPGQVMLLYGGQAGVAEQVEHLPRLLWGIVVDLDEDAAQARVAQHRPRPLQDLRLQPVNVHLHERRRLDTGQAEEGIEGEAHHLQG